MASGSDGARLSHAYGCFDTFGIVSEITSGHVATSYLFALAGILFTAFSYGHLVRKYPYAISLHLRPENL